MTAAFRLRPLLRVALPVVVGAVLVALAILNMALVKTWSGEPEDGVLWRIEQDRVVAVEVAPGQAGDLAGIELGDVLVSIDGAAIDTPSDVFRILEAGRVGQTLPYVVVGDEGARTLTLTLRSLPPLAEGLYYSLALVGILTIIIGASVRLRRPADLATLHFFWVTVAFFGVLAFTASGRYDRLDYFFDWADMVARLVLPPIFLHFALVFPERPRAFVRTTVGRLTVPLLYLPAVVLAAARIAAMTGGVGAEGASAVLRGVEWTAYLYLAACLAAGLGFITRALQGLRSVTAQRQLRWIVWGSTVGALPFLAFYVIPLLVGHAPSFAEYTAILLGCVPLSFASALVRYRLMDVEVIIKKGLLIAAVVLVLAAIYAGTLQLVGLVLGEDNEGSSFWALLATLIVALVAPRLWTSIQNALDRLYYRDRYDYRRALVAFARELNSDLDLDRLSARLVERVHETLGVERIVLYLAGKSTPAQRFGPVATSGCESEEMPDISPVSLLGSRLCSGQTVMLDDPMPTRRLSVDETGAWRGVGLSNFVPCVSNDLTIAALALGHRQNGEPLNSEDMALLGAVAAQAATAIENARLYRELSRKAGEIERLREFSDSVVESLTDGLVVVDLDDRVLRWNRKMEGMLGVSREQACGAELGTLFSDPFVETLRAARREMPSGKTLYRVPMDGAVDDPKRQPLVNASVSPFQTDEGAHAGWIFVLEDVTERANLEEQLRLSEKMAAIGLLAAGVAHEVNTPLTGISSFTQMLLDRSDQDEPRRQLLRKIEQQTFRAAKIVNSLLSLARPSGGDTRRVDLNALIGDVLALLEHQFRTHRIQVRRHLELPAVLVDGVEYKLQQVFLNLLLNARDAMPKGGWLTITTAVSGSEALVEVADSGVGIPSEHLTRIYDPFFTTKPEGRGTGLGLSVTYGIVQEHGGTLTCDSDPTQGTRFRLVLPLADRGGARVAADTAAADAAAGAR